MIKQVGSKWVLFTKDGSKRLGTHDSKAEAEAQERAIEASKQRNAQENEHDEDRYVTLIGATGQYRIAKRNGKDHIVLPVVALVEGVIHPVNAKTKEFVPAEAFSVNASEWDGNPVFAGHPMKEGKPIDGHTVLETCIGDIRETKIDKKRLLMEAWIDPKKCTTEHDKRVLERAKANKTIEVSIGAYVGLETLEGEYDGKKYAAKWKKVRPNHLALLAEGLRGACSVDMGCGALRINSLHDDTVDALETQEEVDAALEVLGGQGSGNFGHSGRPGEKGGSGGGGGGSASAAHQRASEAHGNAAFWAHKMADQNIPSNSGYGKTASANSTTALRLSKAAGSKLYAAQAAHSYVRMAKTAASPADRVKFYKEAAQHHENAAKWHSTVGKLTMRTNEEGQGLLRRLASSFFKALQPPDEMSDRDLRHRLQEAGNGLHPSTTGGPSYYSDFEAYLPVTDPTEAIYRCYRDGKSQMCSHSFTLDDMGQVTVDPTCTPVEPVLSYEPIGDVAAYQDDDSLLEDDGPTLRAACGCGGTCTKCADDHAASTAQGEMTMERKERIAALVANPHSAVKSLKMLEAATDDELKALEDGATAQKTIADKAAADAAALEKANKDLKVAQDALAGPVPEDRLPQEYRDLMAEKKAKDASAHTELVGKLKVAAAHVYTEDQLKAKTLQELKDVASLMKIDTAPADFSGRPVPRIAQEGVSYKAPDPYKPQLDAAKTATTTH